MNKKFSNKLTIFNFIFTLVICVYHFPLWKYGANSTYSFIREKIAYAAMALFFLMSGFLLYQGINSKEDGIKKFQKRLYSLLIPYLIWNIVSIIFKNVLVDRIYPLSFVFLINAFLTGPSNGPIWYLLVTYLLSILAPLVGRFKHKKKTVSAVFLLILTYFYLRYLDIIPTFFIPGDLWYYYNTLSYLPFYIVGAYAGLYLKDALNDNRKSLIISICSVVLFGLSIYIYYFTKLSYLHFFCNLLIPITFFLMFPNCIFVSNLKPITENAFFAYVMHLPILIPLARKIITPIFRIQGTSFWFMILLATTAAIVMYLIATLIVYALKLILFKWNKAFEMLSGNRVKNNLSKYLNKKKATQTENVENNEVEEKNSNATSN
ncbi:MAG: acyltransferase [Clostridia bacterium]|nr:acyltransferase [Clostridia bacterium]